jgi:hypothetical protein
MASIIIECPLDCAAEAAWALLADVGAAHKAFPGVLTDARMEERTRVVTFTNGMVVRELIVNIDPKRRRLAYAVTGAPFLHHAAFMQIVEEGERCRFVWSSDFLPDEVKPMVEDLMKQGTAAFERVAQQNPQPKREIPGGSTPGKTG